MNPFHRNLKDLVKQIKSFADFLMPYNYPQAPQSDEDDICILKTNEVYIDGYSLILYFNKAEFVDCYAESLQISGKYFPFLPFSLVCKIGKAFLGDECLALAEVIRDSRKIYCWNLLTTKVGKPVSNPYYGNNLRNYEGLEYNYLNPKEVTFY